MLGNGNPLQCFCLENPRDKGAWWAAIYGVTQSQTLLKWLSSSSNLDGAPATSGSLHGLHTFKITSHMPSLFSRLSSVTQSCLTPWDPMDYSTPGFPVHHQLPELIQSHVHHVSDAIQPSHPLSSPSPPAFNLSQHQGLFQWVSSSHQVAKILEFQLQHQSFQWILRTDFP